MKTIMLEEFWYQVTTDNNTIYKGLIYDHYLHLARVDFKRDKNLILFYIHCDRPNLNFKEIDNSITLNNANILECKVTRLQHL